MKSRERRADTRNTPERLPGSSGTAAPSDRLGVRNVFTYCLTNTSDFIANDERSSYVDVEAMERAEAELDRFIDRRAREAGDANAIEELWAESVRRHHARRREENRQSWIAFHRGLARAHAAISDEHRVKADALAVAEPGAVS